MHIQMQPSAEIANSQIHFIFKMPFTKIISMKNEDIGHDFVYALLVICISSGLSDYYVNKPKEVH